MYEAVTTQNVISAATETSKPPTSSAFVWPSATSASGIVASRRFWRLYSVRNASCFTVAYAPTATISVVSSANGIQPRNFLKRVRSPIRAALASDARADDRLDDAPLAEVLARDLVDDPSARHHDDAVAQPGELERVARLDDDRDASFAFARSAS